MLSTISVYSYQASQWGHQKGLRDIVVNVPVDVNSTIKQLPRNLEATETIEVKIMRRMTYNNAYISDNVNPSKI